MVGPCGLACPEYAKGTADLYRVKGQLIPTLNNFERVGDRRSTRKHGEDELLRGEITGEEILTIPEITQIEQNTARNLSLISSLPL
jgi:hypothetical protein